MNQGRIWCVVNPSVGLPLLLGAVAVTSLIVHASVMTHTTWMSSYWGGSKSRSAMNDNGQMPVAVVPNAGSSLAVTVTPVPATSATSQASFMITVGPAPLATASADMLSSDPPKHGSTTDGAAGVN